MPNPKKEKVKTPVKEHQPKHGARYTGRAYKDDFYRDFDNLSAEPPNSPKSPTPEESSRFDEREQGYGFNAGTEDGLGHDREEFSKKEH